MTFFLGGEIAMWTDDYCFVDQCFLYKRGKPDAWWMFGPESDSQFTGSESGIVSISSCKYSKPPVISPPPPLPPVTGPFACRKNNTPSYKPPLPGISPLSPHLQVLPVTGPFTCKQKKYTRLLAPAKISPHLPPLISSRQLNAREVFWNKLSPLI